MAALPPDFRDRRGDRVLLIWGGLPYWTVVDRQAERFIDALAAGSSRNQALSEVAGDRPAPEVVRDAARLLASLQRAGVVGGRRLRPPKQRIESITINVTNRCNLACTFCYNRGKAGETAGRHGNGGRLESLPHGRQTADDGGLEGSGHERRADGRELSAAEMIRALDELRGQYAPGGALALLGGEPLLEPEKTLELAAWGARRELKPIVSTNGLLMTPDFARRAASIGLECQVSIDGAEAESHEAIRGKGTFAKALAAVKCLAQEGAYGIMSMVFHSGNVDQIPAYLELALQSGAKEARFIPIKAIAGGSQYQLPDLVQVIRSVVRAVAKRPELQSLLGRDYVSILAQTCRCCSPRQSCGTGCQTFLLDADGTVYPCLNLSCPEMAAGNVSEERFRRIWSSSCILGRVRGQTALAGRPTPCGNCFARHFCMGGCRGETYANTGRLDAPSVTCAQGRAAIVEVMWTLADSPWLVGGKPAYC